MYENLTNDPTSVSVCGLRKGSWSVEEDDLLRKCIQLYGEGNWKRIPKRAEESDDPLKLSSLMFACLITFTENMSNLSPICQNPETFNGLNRCRKSCRWRWLNYLKPSIKRGDFSEDEISIIVKLHKLLGNRWSLIAGRLPGRTINDVKNYCNTHIYKKFSSEAMISSNEGCNANNENDCNNQNTKTNSPTTTTNTSIIDFGPINPMVIDTLDDSAKWWEDIFVELQRDESEGLYYYTSGPRSGSNFREEVSNNVNDGIDVTHTSMNEVPTLPYQWDEDLLEFDVRLWEGTK